MRAGKGNEATQPQRKPRTTRENLLTDVKCKRAAPRSDKKSAKCGDGGGLFLYVTRDGVKRWPYKFAYLGRERLAGGGCYPEVSLAAARAWRNRLRDALHAGRDPIADKRAAVETDRIERAKADADEENTLEKFATAQHARIKGQYRNAKHRAQWIASLRPVFDKLGKKPIAAITEADVLDALPPIIADTPETGRRVKQRLRAVFDAAKIRRLVPYNVMREVAGAAELKVPSNDEEKHLPAMPYTDVPAFLAELRAFERASAAVKLCLEFKVETATRSGEARGARWQEIHINGAVWTDPASDEAHRFNWPVWIIPAPRTKRNRDHVVPLSRAALAVLKQARELGGGELAFPSPMNPEVELSDMALSMTMRRMGRTEVPHGFRSSFAGWARKCTHIRDDAIEFAIAHKVGGKTKRAYQREHFFDERRKLMDRWGAFVTSPPAKQTGKVVAFRSRAS
jgi:integrase